MRTDTVEIYSDATNAAVIRHPGRRFPGLLIQGDTLHNLYSSVVRAAAALRESDDSELIGELEDIREHLHRLVLHYKQVMAAHELPLPFNEDSDA